MKELTKVFCANTIGIGNDFTIYEAASLNKKQCEICTLRFFDDVVDNLNDVFSNLDLIQLTPAQLLKELNVEIKVFSQSALLKQAKENYALNDLKQSPAFQYFNKEMEQ